MKTLFLRILKDNWKKIIVYSAIGLLFVLMYASMYPALKEQSAELDKLLSAYPEELMNAFGMENAGSMFESFESFLGLEHFTIIWPILLILTTASLGSSFIAYEVERKTIQLLLAQPISRTQLFITKYAAGIALTALFVAISIIGIVPLAAMYSINVSLIGFLLLSILGALFGTTLFSISFMFSSFASSPALSSTLTSGVIFGMYALNLVASLKESLVDLKYFSFFYYFDYKNVLLDNKLSIESILVFVICSISCTFIALMQFKKRDI